MKSLEVLYQKRFKHYIYRRELVDFEWGPESVVETVNCYDHTSGSYIGNPRMACFLTKKMGLSNIQKAHASHCVCSIGFDEAGQKWAGWSHRALCKFGIGDKIFEEGFGGDDTLFTEHGSFTITNMEEAKLSAIKFAGSVS